MCEALDYGDNYFLSLNWNKIDYKTTDIVCMRNS